MAARAAEWIQLYDVRGGGPPTPARALSGGNQQKVVLAREIQSNPRLLIAAQPTRGLDVGAIEYVHRRLVEQRDAGCAVLLVSFELDEVWISPTASSSCSAGRSRSSARAGRRTSASSASP